MLVLVSGALAPSASADDEGTNEEASLAYEPVADWSTVPPRNPGRLAPANGALMGTHSDDSTNWSPEEQGIVKLEAALGRHMDINNHYHGEWDSIAEDGLSWLETWDVQSGRIPLVGWGCHDSNKIISGAEDDVIRRTAQNMKAFGHEFFMRYCWEMDGSRKQGTVKGADKFVEAWRRMYRIFQEEGATNVIWVWTANAAGFKDKRKYTNNEPPAPYFYPGDEYVDWIASDGYNWGVSERNQGDRWRQVFEIFDEFMVFARQHPKPIMIGEYGAQEQKKDPQAKARWMRIAHDTLMAKPRTPECPWCGAFSDVAAVVYFDVDYGSHGDWRIMSSETTLQAFKEASDNPWFHQIDTINWPGSANRTRPAGQPAPKPAKPSEAEKQSSDSTAPDEEEVDQPDPPAPESDESAESATEAETAPPPEQSTEPQPAPASDQPSSQPEPAPASDQPNGQPEPAPASDQPSSQQQPQPAPSSDQEATEPEAAPSSDQEATEPEAAPSSDQEATGPEPAPESDSVADDDPSADRDEPADRDQGRDRDDEAKPPERERRSDSDEKRTRSKTRQKKADRSTDSKADRSGRDGDRKDSDRR